MNERDNETVILPSDNDPTPDSRPLTESPDTDGDANDQGGAGFGPEEPSGGMSCLAKGCIISIVLGVILSIVAWYGVNMAIGRIASEAAPEIQKTLETKIDESSFSDEEKERLKGSAKQLTDRMSSGDLNFDDMKNLIEEVAEGPLLMLFAFKMFEAQHVEKSGLEEVEKVDAARLMDRLLRGHVENSIPPEDMQGLFESFPTEQRHGQQQLKEKLTDGEIRKILDDIRTLVDVHAVPDEDFDVDIVDEIDKVISNALDR